ncbi:MAG: hypothetical protein JNL74_10750 [Fibrobacteres bacterium]|nr:hypothetical protein [Fibrobacterota bacterium]
MKKSSLIILFVTTLLFTQTATEKSATDSALKFMNDYAAFCDNDSNSLTDNEWVEKNSMLTKTFKQTHKKIIYDSERSEEGLGVDPIFDAQDYPDSGFVFHKIDDSGQYITLKGKDWPEFQVVVKVIMISKRWLVDGAGIVNIEPAKRAAR